MNSFITSWEEAKRLRQQKESLNGIVVSLDLEDWASRVAMRGFAYALIAMGDEKRGQEILRMIGATE